MLVRRVGRLQQRDWRWTDVAQRLRTILPYAIAAFAAQHYVVHIVDYFITVRPDTLDFAVYYHAAQAFSSGHSIYPLWSGCCFDPSAMDGYTYPPTLAVVLAPLTTLPIGVAGRIFLGFSQLCLLAALVVMWRTVRGMVPLRVQIWLLTAVILFQPIHAGNFGLQVSNLLLLVFAIAAHEFVHGRRLAAAGVVLGIGTAIKLSPGLMLAPFLLLRPRRAAIAIASFAATVTVILLLVSIASAQTPTYFTDVLPRFADGVASIYNRSLPGVILRTIEALGHTPPVVLATLFHLLLIGGLVATWLWCRRSISTPHGRAATFAAFLALMPITETVGWDHHMAADALACVLIAPSLRRFSVSWFAAVAGMLLMSVNQHVVTSAMQNAGIDPPHGVATIIFVGGASVNLLGMALLYAATLRVAGEQRDGAGSRERTKTAFLRHEAAVHAVP